MHLSADDNAPPERKTLWLATFYLCMPVGYALGYIFGGLVGVGLGWRAAFLLEALAMIPLGLFCLTVPPIDLKGTHEGTNRREFPFPGDSKVMWSDPLDVMYTAEKISGIRDGSLANLDNRPLPGPLPYGMCEYQDAEYIVLYI